MGWGVPAISPAAHVWPPRVSNSCRVGLASCDLGQGLRPSSVQWLTGAAREILPLSTGLSCPGLSLPQESKPLTFHRRWIYSPASSHPGSTRLSCVHAAPRGPSGGEPQMPTAPCFGPFPSLPPFPPRFRWFLGSLLRRTTCIQVLDSGSAPGGPQNMTEDERVHLVGCRGSSSVRHLWHLAQQVCPQPRLFLPPLFGLRSHWSQTPPPSSASSFGSGLCFRKP